MPDPRDERRHPPGDDLRWSESHRLDFVEPGGRLAGYLRLALLPAAGRAWFWCAVVGPDRDPVLVVDHEVPVPPAPSLEIRAPGLWAELVVETPLDHLSVGVEAFGVALDDPADAYRGLWGVRTPVGFELDWDTDGPDDSSWAVRDPTGDRYEIPCRVHGEVLLGREAFEIDGFGQRDHSWGVRDWWGAPVARLGGRFDDGGRFHARADGSADGSGYLIDGGVVTEGPATFDDFDVGADGLFGPGTVTVAGRDLRVEPAAWAPVDLGRSDDRRSRFPQALVRVSGPDGRTGHGWMERTVVSAEA